MENSFESFATGWTFDQTGGTAEGYIGKDNVWHHVANDKADGGWYGAAFKLDCFRPSGRASAEKEISRQQDGFLKWEFKWQNSNPAADGAKIGCMQENSCVLDLRPEMAHWPRWMVAP